MNTQACDLLSHAFGLCYENFMVFANVGVVINIHVYVQTEYSLASHESCKSRLKAPHCWLESSSGDMEQSGFLLVT